MLGPGEGARIHKLYARPVLLQGEAARLQPAGWTGQGCSWRLDRLGSVYTRPLSTDVLSSSPSWKEHKELNCM